VRARYDAAVTSDENRRHWAHADGLSANAAANPVVRRTLRNRARYEVANNSYARGIVLTLANDTVGTGPRLQLLTADAAPSMTFEGTVAAVTTVGTSSQGVVTFPVTVIIPNPDPALKPGMSAAVSIITEERADVLLVPNRAIRVSNGQRSVTVMFEGQQFSVPVTLGLSNDSYTEVVEGSLKEGDTVVTRSSTTTTTQNSAGGLFGFLGGGPAVVRP